MTSDSAFERLLWPDNRQGSGLNSYLSFRITDYERLLTGKPEDYWTKLGEHRALQLFHNAAVNVPAYKNFLKKHKVNHHKIKTITDFARVPLTDKQNYIQQYPLAARAWGGTLAQTKITAASSGTTGMPQFWPRSNYQELEAALTHELLYKHHFQIDRYKTLLVIGFPMGVYVSGMATVLPSWLVAQKDYPLTIVTAGNNKQEVLKAVKNLGRGFEQIILIGHPFFIKDVIETGKQEGINWSRKKLRLMLCSEGFTEEWREYLMGEAGIKKKFGQTLSTYGSSEMLLMAYETPFSISLKELAEKNLDVQKKLFGRVHTPSVFQYNPLLRYIESVERELIFTCNSGLPLIRFNLHDSGLCLKFSQAAAVLNQHSRNWKKRIKPWPLWQLPVVALWGRSDHTIIFYAANIYPEHIHHALHQRAFIPKLTGKFTLHKDYYKNMDEFLEINLELRMNVKPTAALAKTIRQSVTEKLLAINMEYLFLWNNLDLDIRPKIKLWPYQHPKYFKPGLKPRYILQ